MITSSTKLTSNIYETINIFPYAVITNQDFAASLKVLMIKNAVNINRQANITVIAISPYCR